MYVEAESEVEPEYMIVLKRWACSRDELEEALQAFNTEAEPEDLRKIRMMLTLSSSPIDEDEMKMFKMGDIVYRMKKDKEILESECIVVYKKIYSVNRIFQAFLQK